MSRNDPAAGRWLGATAHALPFLALPFFTLPVLALPILALSTLALPASLHAGPRCGAYDDLQRWLTTEKGLTRLGTGRTSDGTAIEIYIAPSGETSGAANWAALAQVTESRACLLTEGNAWHSDHVPSPSAPLTAPEGVRS